MSETPIEVIVPTETKAPSIIQALASVMEDVQSVGKKDRNSAQGFSFRGIDAVVNAVAPALRKHQVIVVPNVLEHEYASVEIGKNRTPMSHVTLKVLYKFIGQNGDYVEAVVLAEAMDSGDKAISKAMSVAFRTALLQSLALPTNEPDPDASSYERSTPKPSATLDDYNTLHAGLLEADTKESLTLLAQKVSEFNFSEEEKKSLRVVYTKRFTELEG
jgi:hypothetical protein